MNMSMQGGKAPKNARDPNAYADGYEYGPMPGLEQVDRLAVRRVFVEQAEGTYRDPGGGAAWDMQAWYGPDEQKLWLRTEGSVDSGRVGATTTGEALWWRAFAPFWATQLGVRQDLGAGAHTYAAAGVQGLAPYWFEVEATGYVGEDGRLSARFKASYELLFTNRLILTPKIESNLYSRAESKRDLGTGVGNVELGLRLRYEIRRKFAPYVGYVWDRALGDTADRLRANGKNITDSRLVAGVRIWF
jgi:copper resistance protein B